MWMLCAKKTGKKRKKRYLKLTENIESTFWSVISESCRDWLRQDKMTRLYTYAINNKRLNSIYDEKFKLIFSLGCMELKAWIYVLSRFK